MGIFSNIFTSGNKNKADKRYQQALQQQSANQDAFAAQLLKTSDEAPIRQDAAEKGKLQVASLLGKPGTYGPTLTSTGPPSTSTATPTSGVGDIFDPNKPVSADVASLLSNPNITPAQRAEIMSNYQGVLDPAKYSEAIGQTADFQIMSNLTAQYQQGINEMGPLWDQYKSSVTGPIIEGAATAYAEARDTIMQNAAKGGTARQVAMTQAQTLQAQEASNRMKSQNLWQANLAMKETMIKGAREQVQLNEDYLNNMPFQNTYNDTMNHLTEFIAGTAIPKAAVLSSSADSNNIAYRAMKLESAGKVNWVGKFVGGAITALAGSLIGGANDGSMNTGTVGAIGTVATGLFGGGNSNNSGWSIDRGKQQPSGWTIDSGAGPQKFGIFGKQE